jgi:hypothetical protein
MLCEYSFRELCSEAELILEGKVLDTDISTGKVDATHTLSITYTDHQVRILSALKSPPYQVGERLSVGRLGGMYLTVRTLGGTFDEHSIVVDGEASMQRNENIIIFLTRDFPVELPLNVFTVLGGYQGKYAVVGSGTEAFTIRTGSAEQIPLVNLKRQIRDNLGYGSLTVGGAAGV